MNYLEEFKQLFTILSTFSSDTSYVGKLVSEY